MIEVPMNFYLRRIDLAALCFSVIANLLFFLAVIGPLALIEADAEAAYRLPTDVENPYQAELYGNGRALSQPSHMQTTQHGDSNA